MVKLPLISPKNQTSRRTLVFNLSELYNPPVGKLKNSHTVKAFPKLQFRESSLGFRGKKRLFCHFSLNQPGFGKGSVCFLLLLVLLPCVLFNTFVEFTKDIKEMAALSSAISGGETSESSGTTHIFSENILLCGQPLTQNRSPFNKFWRQLLSLISFALFLKTFSNVTFRKCYLHYYLPRKFFHTLVTSLLLSGRAPPRFV
jgi:hypothetical protein